MSNILQAASIIVRLIGKYKAVRHFVDVLVDVINDDDDEKAVRGKLINCAHLVEEDSANEQ